MRKNMLRGAANSAVILVGYSTTQEASNEYTVSLSGINWEAGDLAVVCTGLITNDAHTLTGFTLQADVTLNGPLHLFTRTLQAGDTTFTSSGVGSPDTCSILAVFRGYAHDTAPAEANSSTGQPDAPSEANVVATDVVIPMMMHKQDYTAVAPSGYDLVASISSTTDTFTVAMAYATGLSGTVDPGTWGGWDTTDDGWGCMTYAIAES